MGPVFANRGMKKGPTEKSDRFFKFIIEKRELASKPFMPHFDINYIIFKQGKKSKDFFSCFIVITFNIFVIYKYRLQLIFFIYPLKYKQVNIFERMLDFY